MIGGFSAASRLEAATIKTSAQIRTQTHIETNTYIPLVEQGLANILLPLFSFMLTPPFFKIVLSKMPNI